MQHAGIELGPHRYDATLQTSTLCYTIDTGKRGIGNGSVSRDLTQQKCMNRTMQREAASRACGKRGVLCTVYVSSPLHWPYVITYSSVWITLDAVLGM